MDDIEKKLEAQKETAPPKKKSYRAGRKRETSADKSVEGDLGVPSPYASERVRRDFPRKTDGSEHDYTAAKQGRGSGKHGKAPPFKKGNKMGQTKLPPEVRGVKDKLTPTNIKRLISKFADLSVEGLKEKLADPKTTMMEHMIGNVMLKAAMTADPVRFEFLLNRSVGKVKEQKEIEVKPVVYKTNVNPDGSLLQAIIEEEAKSLPAAHEILENAADIDPSKEDLTTIDAEVTSE